MFEGYNSILTVQEVADAMQVSSGHIYHLVREQKIPHFKVGKSIRFEKSKLVEAFTNGM